MHSDAGFRFNIVVVHITAHAQIPITAITIAIIATAIFFIIVTSKCSSVVVVLSIIENEILA